MKTTVYQKIINEFLGREAVDRPTLLYVKMAYLFYFRLFLYIYIDLTLREWLRILYSILCHVYNVFFLFVCKYVNKNFWVPAGGQTGYGRRMSR